MADRSLDHFVIAVESLESASATYRRLGFHVRPIARHEEIGSSNCVIHFPRTYLELFSPGESSRAIRETYRQLLEPYRQRLLFGEGIAHVSLDSTDLEADRRLMQERGLSPEPTLNARRKIIRPDGTPDETASRCFYMWRPDSRFLSLFLSEHPRPETIFIPEYEDHANSAAEVSRVVYMSRDPAGDVDYFSRLFGQAPDTLSERGFAFVGRRGDVTEVLTIAAARDRYGSLLPAPTCEPLAGVGVAMHFATHSMARCAAHLSGAGVPFERRGQEILVPGNEACGMTMVFEA